MSVQAQVESVRASSGNRIQVQIDGICCSITCDNEEIYRQLQQQYIDFLSDKPADISIDVEIADRMSYDQVKAAIPGMEFRREGNRVISTNMTYEVEYDAANLSLGMKVDKHLFDPALDFKLMNRILPAAYYSVCGVRCGVKPPAMLVHACSIIRHGQALVFTGPSETGKTTVARLCGNKCGCVINDEMVLVSWPDKKNHAITVQGAPIIGEAARRNVGAPLACVILLKQSKQTVFRKLGRLEAYLRFIRQVIEPVDLVGSGITREMLLLATEFSDAITSNTVSYELEFNLQRELLWEVVGELEKSLVREEPTK